MAAVRAPFGRRLAAAMAARGPLCVGIDPHAALLTHWGLDDDVAGLERFSLTVVEALGDRVAVLKPQVAFFERHGSRGVAVLERVLAEAASAGALTIADAKRGDIGSTMAAYADAFAGEGSPLAADAVTVSPYLGVGALDPLLDLALANGRGAFVLALTSNPEGAAVQHARDVAGRTVAGGVLAAVAARNAAELASLPPPGATLGSIGVVVGATVDPAVVRAGGGDADLAVHGPILAPGVGAQGGGARELAALFGDVRAAVLPSTSREVLAGGPSIAGLRAAAETSLAQVSRALSGTPA
jgi:orotidine-5'-phosphate decarboxylase